MDVTSKLDGMYWGVMLSSILLGITLVQGWIYVHNNNDKWHLRLLVAILILLDLTSTCLTFHFLRYYLMVKFGSLEALSTLTQTMIAWLAVADVTAYIVKMFFASRLYLLDKSNPWPPAVVTLFATGALVSIALQVDSNRKDARIVRLSSTRMKLQLGIGLSFASLADLVITAGLFRKLTSANTHVKRTRSMIQKLILWVVTRYLLVAVNQITLLIIYMTQTQTMYWMPFLLFDPKLHVIAMLAILNARRPPAIENTKSDTVLVPLSFASTFQRSQGRTFNSSTNMSDVEGSRDVRPQPVHLPSLPNMVPAGQHSDISNTIYIGLGGASRISPSQEKFAPVHVEVTRQE